MTQFKDKAGKDRENASLGLYAYPNLMAADILVYRATHVPVGDDQKQHLELARDIAQKFNNDFGDSIRAHGFGDAFFPQPEPLITGPATRVMSLRDGAKKMSKSDPSDYSRINLNDDADAIAQKIRKAKTDPEPLPSEEKGLETRPEADNLVGIYAALAARPKADVLREFGGGQFSSFKAALVDLAVDKLGPVGAEMKRLTQESGIRGFGADRRRRARPRHRRRDHERGEGHRRLHPQALRRSIFHLCGGRESGSVKPRSCLVAAARRVAAWTSLRLCAGQHRGMHEQPARSYEQAHKPKCLVHRRRHRGG